MNEDKRSETPMGAHILRALTRVKYINMNGDTIALNPLTEKIHHFMKNVRPIIGKEKENARPITSNDLIIVSTNRIIHLLNLLLLYGE